MERECCGQKHQRKLDDLGTEIWMVQITRSGLIITRDPLLMQHARIIQHHGVEQNASLSIVPTDTQRAIRRTKKIITIMRMNRYTTVQFSHALLQSAESEAASKRAPSRMELLETRNW